MKALLDKMKMIDASQLDYKKLFDFILPFEPRDIAYKEFLPKIVNPKEYSRRILMLNPIELVLIHWPPGVESAIHLHEGFWGYVGVLEGEALNVEYTIENKTLIQNRAVIVKRSGLIPEPDGVIHKITNASLTKPLITLHFYFPAMPNLDGLKLFSTDGTIVELNSKAPSASLFLPKDCYKSYKKSQFSFEDGSKGKTHLISPIIPKPSNKEIKEMIQDYYTEQAHSYDNSDLEDDKRRIYVDAINKIIVKEFLRIKPHKVLDLATGTGRRASKIKEMTGLDYELYGVDLNLEMCEQAKKKGIIAYCSDWLDVSIKDEDMDIITMLYSFGHIPSSSERIQFLEKIHFKLKPGGVFYFDVFNINDPYEWGPRALALFEEYNLDYFGYEKGDVFYKRKEMEKVSFLHYFEEERLVALLESLGFEVESVVHMGYVHKSGEILSGIEGKLLIKAIKK